MFSTDSGMAITYELDSVIVRTSERSELTKYSASNPRTASKLAELAASLEFRLAYYLSVSLMDPMHSALARLAVRRSPEIKLTIVVL